MSDWLEFNAPFNNFQLYRSDRLLSAFPGFLTNTRQPLASSRQLHVPHMKQRWVIKIVTRSRTCTGWNWRSLVHKPMALLIELRSGRSEFQWGYRITCLFNCCKILRILRKTRSFSFYMIMICMYTCVARSFKCYSIKMNLQGKFYKIALVIK